MMSILDMLNGCDVYDMMRFYSLDAHKNYQAYCAQATDACEFSPSADSQHSYLLLLSVNPTEGERGPFQLVAVHSLAHLRSMLRCDLRSWHSVVSSKRSGERGCIEQHAGFAGERRRVHSKSCGRGGCGSRLDQRSDTTEEESGGDRELSGRHADSLHAGAGRRGESMNPRRTTASCSLFFTPTPTRSSGSSSTRRTLVSQRLYVPSSRWCAFASLFPVD